MLPSSRHTHIPVPCNARCWKANSIDNNQICHKEEILIYSSLILLHFPLGFTAVDLHGLPFAVNNISLYRNLNNESTVSICLDSKNEQIFSPTVQKEQHKNTVIEKG